MTFDEYASLMRELIADDLELHGLDRCTSVSLAPKETRELVIAQQATQAPAWQGATITMETEHSSST